jgi:transcriptional regulator with XRE-family HTH domain
MDIKKNLGKRVKELRLHHGYSQEAFSHECGLDRTYIASLENGGRNISIVNIQKISIAFKITLADFFDSGLFSEN